MTLPKNFAELLDSLLKEKNLAYVYRNKEKELTHYFSQGGDSWNADVSHKR